MDDAQTRPSLINRLREHRWESLLLIGIPIAAGIVHLIALLIGYIVAWASEVEPIFVLGTVSSLTTAIILAALRPFARRGGRTLLKMAWDYLMAVALVQALVVILAGLLSDLVDSRLWDVAFLAILSFLHLPVALWFARRASTTGLVYAYFLINIGVFSLGARSGVTMRDSIFSAAESVLPDMGASALFALLTLVTFAFSLTAAIVGVWALANFDSWRLPKKIVAVVAVYGYRAFLAIGGTLLVFLIYALDASSDETADLIAAGALLAGALLLGYLLEIVLVYLVRDRREAGTA